MDVDFSECTVEEALYGDSPDFSILGTVDTNYAVRLISKYSKYRPFRINDLVHFCQGFGRFDEIKGMLLGLGIEECPALIYKMFISGLFCAIEVVQTITMKKSFISSYFFHNHIDGFDDYVKTLKIPIMFHKEFFEDLENVSRFFDYGFPTNSIEFCLKYDDLSSLKRFFEDPCFEKAQKIEWSPFEWALAPSGKLNCLEFSGYFGSITCFKYLLMNGFSVDDCTTGVSTCSGSVDIYHICSRNMTDPKLAIQYSSMFNNVGILQNILESINLINWKNGKVFPLHYASKEGHLNVVQFLDRHGFNINQADKKKMSCLHYAAFNGHYEVVKYLVMKGADLNSTCNSSITPLHLCSWKGHLQTVKFLVEAGADINIISDGYPTGPPINWALNAGHTDIVSFFLDIKTKYPGWC